MNNPYLINFNTFGEGSIGYISVAENKSLPFNIERIYWTYHTPEGVIRGFHAHYFTEQILIAVAGKITVFTEMPNGSKCEFILETPNIGVYLPKFCWHTMKYSHSAVQMCIANNEFSETDYIRDYEVFKKLP
jgi:dTDP-4-dehydrorhamnose 3,5-epimerase-like enzyme